MTTTVSINNVTVFDATVAIDGTASFYNVPAGATITAVPGGGGTMTVKVRPSPKSALVVIETGTASYSAAVTLALNGPVYEVEFGAATAAGYGAVSV